MDSVKEIISGLKANSPDLPWSFVLILPVLLLLFRSFRRADDEPISLPNKGVPLIGNTIQYIMDNAAFISRARYVLILSTLPTLSNRLQYLRRKVNAKNYP